MPYGPASHHSQDGRLRLRSSWGPVGLPQNLKGCAVVSFLEARLRRRLVLRPRLAATLQGAIIATSMAEAFFLGCCHCTSVLLSLKP
jgi:hypothetical protein